MRLRWALGVLVVWMLFHALVFQGTVVPPDTYLYAFYTLDISPSYAWKHFPEYVYELREASSGFIGMLGVLSAATGAGGVELAFIPAGVAVVVLSYVLARCFTGERRAAMIALLVAVYPYGRVIADSFFSRTTLGAALVLGVLVCYFRWMRGRERGACLLMAALMVLALGMLYYTLFYVMVIVMLPMLGLHLLLALRQGRVGQEAGFALVFLASAGAALVLSKGGISQLVTTFEMLLTRGGVLAVERESYTVGVWYHGRFLRELLLFLLHLVPYAASALLFLYLLWRRREKVKPEEAAVAGSILGLAGVAIAFYLTGSKLPRFLEMSTFSMVPMLGILGERLGERGFSRLFLLLLLVGVPTSLYGLTTPNINAQKIDAQEMHACAFAGSVLPESAELYTDMKGINCLVLFGSHFNVRTSVNYGGSLTTRRVEGMLRVLYDESFTPPEELQYLLIGDYMYRVAVAPYSVLEPTRREVLERLMQENTVLYNNGRVQVVKLVH